MIQQTSLQAYQEIRQHMGERQRQVYHALMSLGEATNSMISQSSGIPINVVTPRINELRKARMVVFAKEGFCPITGKRALFWRCS